MDNIKEKDLVRQIANDTGLTIGLVEKVLESFKDVVIDNLSNGASTSLIGFGMFEPFTRTSRNGINPQNLETMKIPEVKVGKFRTGYRMKKALKGIS